MSNWVKTMRKTAVWVAAALLSSAIWAQSTSYPGIGRQATAKEIARWDIDVRPDFLGLPAGSGSVAKGQDVWEAKCALCHGIFGESNEVFSPLIGGTTADDIKTGHVAYLSRTDYPGRTTIMKVATVSTLWDYINRAMPWNAPKSLSVDEVYAVTAFLLNLGDIVPADFTLSDKNIAEVQQRMPNRNGMSTQHALWPGNEFGAGKIKPDTQAKACMTNCEVPIDVSSRLPPHAADAWGNLHDQNRLVGPQRGEVTTKDDGKSGAAAKPAADPQTLAAIALTQKNGCTACHGMSAKLVGPGFAEIAKKNAGRADYLAGKIVSGGEGVWGNVPMPAQTLSPDDAKAIAAWLAAGAKAN